MNLVRELLLLIDEQGNDVNDWIDDIEVEGFSEDQIAHHIWMLADGGFIEAEDASNSDGSLFLPRCLTWKGYEFLADIKDKDIWARTVNLAKQGGVESLSAIWGIAKKIGTKKLEKLMGIED